MSKTSGVRSTLREVLAVVVGILLALSADQWVEDRRDRLLGMEYLRTLERDLVDDSGSLATSLTRYGNQVTALDTLLDRFTTPSARRAEPDDFVIRLVTSFGGGSVDLQMATYEDLQNTGNLRLLGELGFRSLIVEYFQESRVIEAKTADEWAGAPQQAAYMDFITAMPTGFFRPEEGGSLTDWDPLPLLDIMDRRPDALGALRIQWVLVLGWVTDIESHAERNAELLVAVRRELAR